VRVARSFASGEVRVEHVADPEPGAGEVVCDVLACGVCASDVTDWYVAPKLPAVLGHEPAGVVHAVGDGVSSVAVGDRVAIHHHAPCGECRRCRRGHETMCDRFRATRLDPGGFAERVRVPAELVGELLALPDDLDPVGATFIEPLACVLRAADRAGLRAGDSLLVVGAGVNGLLTIAAAHARAVDAVWVREPRPDRLALAESWGAEHHGNELVDVAIVGNALVLRELTVTASYSAGPDDMRSALHLIESGQVDPRPLISHRLPLEETGRALELQRRGEALKVVVQP
jgi:L-iditol 2-dehydrogenase